MELPPFLTQSGKTQNPFKGELSHGVITKVVYEGVQAGCGAAIGARGNYRRSGAGVESSGQSQATHFRATESNAGVKAVSLS